MNYIGSKHKLSDFITSTVKEVVGNDLSDKVFCDLFAGTGIVGRTFKTKVKSVISNDLEYYSYVIIKNYIENTSLLNLQEKFDEINKLPGTEGFIFNEYAQGGSADRLYFSSENGQKIDAVRSQLEVWRKNKEISESEYFYMLASIIESADKVANTASVYGAYLKHLKKSAQKSLLIEPANFEITNQQNQVYNEDANNLIKKINGDILYLDPPYNARQYGANYHLLNTIARYDIFEPKGKTGLRNYNKSDYCSKASVKASFEELIKNANFKYLFLSYNNEGLMSADEIRQIMSKFGRYDLMTQKYQRFKADKTENRNHIADSTTEYLHILEK